MKIPDRICTACERFWLFTIAAIALAVVAAVILPIVFGGKMPAGAGELLSSAVTGLLMIAQKVVDAQQSRRLADQLARSTPAADMGDR